MRYKFIMPILLCLSVAAILSLLFFDCWSHSPISKGEPKFNIAFNFGEPINDVENPINEMCVLRLRSDGSILDMMREEVDDNFIKLLLGRKTEEHIYIELQIEDMKKTSLSTVWKLLESMRNSPLKNP